MPQNPAQKQRDALRETANALENEAQALRDLAKKIPTRGAWVPAEKTRLETAGIYMARRTWGKSKKAGEPIVCKWERKYGWVALFPKWGLNPTLEPGAGVDVWLPKKPKTSQTPKDSQTIKSVC